MEKNEQERVVREVLELYPDPRMKAIIKSVIKYLPRLWEDMILLGSFKERVRGLADDDEDVRAKKELFKVNSEPSLDLIAKMVAADIQISALKQHCVLWKKAFFVMAEEEGLPANVNVSLKLPELVIYSKYENEADKLLCIAEAARKVVMADMESVRTLALGNVPDSLSFLEELPVKAKFFAELAAVCVENQAIVRGIFHDASPGLSVEEPCNPLLFLGILKKEVLKTLGAEEYKQEAIPSIVRKILVFDAVADSCLAQAKTPDYLKAICGKIVSGEITEKQRALLQAMALDPKEAQRWSSSGPTNLPEYFVVCARVLSGSRRKD